jgi:hypothetical protein
MPEAPFKAGLHGRVPPVTAPLDGLDPRIRGVGQSDLQPLVPSAQQNPGSLQQMPFLALLVAINAPQNLLTFDPPNPSLAAPAYAQYVQAIPAIPSLPGTSRPPHVQRDHGQDRDKGDNADFGGGWGGGVGQDVRQIFPLFALLVTLSSRPLLWGSNVWYAPMQLNHSRLTCYFIF